MALATRIAEYAADYAVASIYGKRSLTFEKRNKVHKIDAFISIRKESDGLHSILIDEEGYGGVFGHDVLILNAAGVTVLLDSNDLLLTSDSRAYSGRALCVDPSRVVKIARKALREPRDYDTQLKIYCDATELPSVLRSVLELWDSRVEPIARIEMYDYDDYGFSNGGVVHRLVVPDLS